ncbi:MAG: TrkH family potassium uptake protein, partial [Flavobacteriaceae bacterium]|nr:TrkH family potassium uptake protein [Flavobacteriaceae bacterium]
MSGLSKINLKLIGHLIGLLFCVNGGFMFVATLISYFYQDGVFNGMLQASLLAVSLGTFIMWITRNHRKEIQKKEGYIIVAFGWFFMALIGTLPYLLTSAIPNFTDAFFETMSGFTTTGASILSDVEALPQGVLLWRSITHWIGGMGIIVLAIAILPLLGIGGMQLFAAEAPGPGTDKLHPRITDTAKRLWLIYFGYTAAETIFLKLAGMSFFDALNHSMSTLSTGGFSTKNASLAHWNDTPLIQYIVVLFMFLAGTNFVLSYFGFKANFSRIFKDEEFRLYVKFILVFTMITAVVIYYNSVFSSSSSF